MEEISCLKRGREGEGEGEEGVKRQKSYKDIIIETLLTTTVEEEEDITTPTSNSNSNNNEEATQDLSSVIFSLQEEISSSSSSSPSSSPYAPAQAQLGYCKPDDLSTEPDGSSGSEEEEENDVMEHLLHASDDELGIPNTNTKTNNEEEGGQVEGGDKWFPFPVPDPIVGDEGLWEWEFEDYYTFLHSHILL